MHHKVHLMIYTISVIGYFCIFSGKTMNSWPFCSPVHCSAMLILALCSATVHYDAVLSHILCIILWFESFFVRLIVRLRLQNFASTCRTNHEASTWDLPTDRCEISWERSPGSTWALYCTGHMTEICDHCALCVVVFLCICVICFSSPCLFCQCVSSQRGTQNYLLNLGRL